MAYQGDSIFWVELQKIVPNPYQPRREFDEQKLKELAESIRMYGVLQPLVVTRKEIQRDDGGLSTEYELIAGERRLRASKLAGLSQVPVIIRSGEESDLMKLELAIIENLQREDLNPVDRALAFKQLADQFKLSHSQVAKKVGRSREYISNSLRILQLPEEILSAIKRGELSEGHGRTLLMLTEHPEEQMTIFKETMLKKLSVREVERISRKIAINRVRKKDWQVDPELLEIERQLTESFGTRVHLERKDYGGKLVIDYFSPEDLRKILTLVHAGDADGTVKIPASLVTEADAPIADDAVASPSSGTPEERSEDTPVQVSDDTIVPPSDEPPVDDRSKEEQEEDDSDLYAIKNFSL